jgi:hypothetical protein
MQRLTVVVLTTFLLLFSSICFSQSEPFIDVNQRENSETQESTIRFTPSQTNTSLLVEYQYELWRESVWVSSYHQHTTYSPSGKKLQTLTKFWVDTLSTWRINAKRAYNYDSSGLLVWDISYSHTDTGWRNSTQYYYYYDRNWNMTEQLRVRWSGYTWDSSATTKQQFDSLNNRIVQSQFQYRTRRWMKAKQYFYSYDSLNRKVEEISESGDNRNVWNAKNRKIYGYANDGKLQVILSLNKKKDDWIVSKKSEYEYDDNGNVIKILRESWDGEHWDKYSETFYTYGVKNKSKEEKDYYWRDSLWVPLSWNSYLYDGQNNILEEINRFWRDSVWVPSIRYKYAYQPLAVDKSENDFKQHIFLSPNFPNPFNPQTTIRYSLSGKSHVTVSIYNLLGENITTLVDEVQEAGDKSIVFDVNSIKSSLASGIYFYRLQTGLSVVTRKMLLLR